MNAPRKPTVSGRIPGGGLFFYFGPEPTKEELARRWFVYGFNDYVEGSYSRSFYDYISYVVDTKANDERGQWIRAWMQYGYTLGILYYEILHPDLEPRYSAIRKDEELIDSLNLDYTQYPPGYGGGLESWELVELTDLYSIVRVKKDSDKVYSTVDVWHSSEKYRDVFDTLVKLGYPENYELITIHYWKKGAGQ